MLLEFISVPGMCFPYRGSADSQSFHARSFREANISLHTSYKVWFCYCFINSLPFCWSCPKFLHCSIIHFYFQPLFPTKSLTLTVSHLVTGGKLQQHSCNSPVWSISSSVCEREDLPLPFSLSVIVGAVISSTHTSKGTFSLFLLCPQTHICSSARYQCTNRVQECPFHHHPNRIWLLFRSSLQTEGACFLFGAFLLLLVNRYISPYDTHTHTHVRKSCNRTGRKTKH